MGKPSNVESLNDPKVRRSVTKAPPAAPAQTEFNMVRVIKRSLLLFNISWLGLIPLLGVAPALIALRLHLKIRKDVAAGGWNPARKYNLMGVTVAFFGLAISLVLWAFAFTHAWRLLV